MLRASRAAALAYMLSHNASILRPSAGCRSCPVSHHCAYSLQSQLERVSAACLTVTSFDERLEQAVSAIRCLEEKTLNLARLVAVTQQFAEQQEAAQRESAAEILRRLRGVEARLQELEEPTRAAAWEAKLRAGARRAAELWAGGAQSRTPTQGTAMDTACVRELVHGDLHGHHAVPARLPPTCRGAAATCNVPSQLLNPPCNRLRSSAAAVSAQVDAKLAEVGANSEAGLAEAAGRLQAALEEGCHTAHLALEKRMGEAAGGCGGCSGSSVSYQLLWSEALQHMRELVWRRRANAAAAGICLHPAIGAPAADLLITTPPCLPALPLPCQVG